MKTRLAGSAALATFLMLGTALAAPVTIRNCTGAPVDVQVRDAGRADGAVHSAITNLPHGGMWSGRCSPEAQTCAVEVDRYLSGKINVLTAGPVCVVPTTSDTVLPLPMNACPC